MKFKFKIKSSWWIFIAIYIILIYVIVQIEKANPDANIKTIADGFWYSIVTLTTVGYGDYYPVTGAGKIVGLVVIFSSLGVLGVLIGNISNIIRTRMENKKKGFNGTKFTNHFVIIGWDDFAKDVAEQIIHTDSKVAIITNKLDELEIIKDLYDDDDVFVLLSDYENFELLKKANINQSGSVFFNFNDDTKTLIYLINLQKHFEIKSVVALQSSKLKETFQSVGAKHIIAKNDITSKLVASYIFEPDVASFTEDLIATSIENEDYDMHEFLVTEDNPFLNKNYLESFIDLKKNYNSVLIGISKYNDGKYQLLKNPVEDIKIELKDYLIIISSSQYQKQLEQSFGIKEGIKKN